MDIHINSTVPTPEFPELILKGRFQSISKLARDFAQRTTSNLTIDLRQNRHLTLTVDGDFLIILDNDCKRCLIKLLNCCSTFHIFPNGKMFQLVFYFDLQLQE